MDHWRHSWRSEKEGEPRRRRGRLPRIWTKVWFEVLQKRAVWSALSSRILTHWEQLHRCSCHSQHRSQPSEGWDRSACNLLTFIIKASQLSIDSSLSHVSCLQFPTTWIEIDRSLITSYIPLTWYCHCLGEWAGTRCRWRVEVELRRSYEPPHTIYRLSSGCSSPERRYCNQIAMNENEFISVALKGMIKLGVLMFILP